MDQARLAYLTYLHVISCAQIHYVFGLHTSELHTLTRLSSHRTGVMSINDVAIEAEAMA